jgi:hypothetical protein
MRTFALYRCFQTQNGVRKQFNVTQRYLGWPKYSFTRFVLHDAKMNFPIIERLFGFLYRDKNKSYYKSRTMQEAF